MGSYVIYTDPYGRKRKGVEKECLVCKKKFLTRKDRNCYMIYIGPHITTP
jgi:hypothetical protein